MYGFKKHTGNADQLDVDDARLQIFSKVYQSGWSNPMSKVKGLDGSSLPPCNTVLFQQILRANSICSGWNFATDPKPHIFPPDKNGWRKEKNNSGVESYNRWGNGSKKSGWRFGYWSVRGRQRRRRRRRGRRRRRKRRSRRRKRWFGISWQRCRLVKTINLK